MVRSDYICIGIEYHLKQDVVDYGLLGIVSRSANAWRILMSTSPGRATFENEEHKSVQQKQLDINYSASPTVSFIGISVTYRLNHLSMSSRILANRTEGKY